MYAEPHGGGVGQLVKNINPPNTNNKSNKLNVFIPTLF